MPDVPGNFIWWPMVGSECIHYIPNRVPWIDTKCDHYGGASGLCFHDQSDHIDHQCPWEGYPCGDKPKRAHK